MLETFLYCVVGLLVLLVIIIYYQKDYYHKVNVYLTKRLQVMYDLREVIEVVTHNLHVPQLIDLIVRYEFKQSIDNSPALEYDLITILKSDVNIVTEEAKNYFYDSDYVIEMYILNIFTKMSKKQQSQVVAYLNKRH